MLDHRHKPTAGMQEQGANIKVICVVLKGPVRCVILKGSMLHKQPSLRPKGLKQTKATQIYPQRPGTKDTERQKRTARWTARETEGGRFRPQLWG